MHILKNLLLNEDTILICASDLSYINNYNTNDSCNYNIKLKTPFFQTIKYQDNDIMQFIYNGVNGIKRSTTKIDDILFIKDAPTHGTMAMYFFAKLLNSYSGGLDYSSSSSSSSESSYGDTILIKNKIFENHRILYPENICHYTSLSFPDNIENNKSSKLININNNNSIDYNSYCCNKISNYNSISYASIIFTLQSNIEYQETRENKKNKQIDNLLSEYYNHA
jgi:hypothetical protein